MSRNPAGLYTMAQWDFVPVKLAAKIGGQNIENRQRQFAIALAAARKKGVDRWYGVGGEYFLEWVKRYHRTNEGEPLRWDEPFQEEYYLLLGNPWVVRVIVEKASQMGYSESLTAIAAFMVAEVRIPTAMGFEVSSKVTDMVGDRIQPSFDHCEPVKQLRAARFAATGRRDTDSRRRKMTVGGVPLTFFYAGTKSSKTNTPERQASSAMSSFTAWGILGDEIELWPSGALDIAAERQSACPMETKPFRGGSTPGQEGGVVDAQLKASGYIFEWHVDCPSCKVHQAISALGNLIRPVKIRNEDGDMEETYLDISGKPYDWFHRDSTNWESKVATSYVGCNSCGVELTGEVMDRGRFETASGVVLLPFLKQITKDRTPVNETVALRLPRLASKLFKPPERIRTLLTTLNPADQLQQGLGLAVSVGGGKISLPRILACVGAKNPLADTSDCTVMTSIGVDQGIAKNYYVVHRWHFPPGKTWEIRWMNAHVEVVTYGEAAGFAAIAALARKHRAHIIGMDNEPEVSLAGEFARKHPLEPMGKVISSIDKPRGLVVLMDQVSMKGQQFRRTIREVQGDQIPVYSIHRTFGLDQVRNRIYHKLYSLPIGTVYNSGDNGNFVYHFITSDRQPNGKWTEPKGLPDHYLHADNFSQMAMLVADAEPNTSGFSFTSINRR